MAKVGLKYMICAEIIEEGAGNEKTVDYEPGLVVGKAIKADIKIDTNEAKLYADDRVVENIKEFKGGTVTLNTDDLDYEIMALLFGHEKTTLDDPPGEGLIAGIDDEGAYVGVGFCSGVIRDNKRKYRAVWLHKTKFGVPSETMETKGENINFQTPTIEGTVMADILGKWKTEFTFDKEESAVDWLNQMANI